jgi:hypothetical protein
MRPSKGRGNGASALSPVKRTRRPRNTEKATCYGWIPDSCSSPRVRAVIGPCWYSLACGSRALEFRRIRDTSGRRSTNFQAQMLRTVAQGRREWIVTTTPANSITSANLVSNRVREVYSLAGSIEPFQKGHPGRVEVSDTPVRRLPRSSGHLITQIELETSPFSPQHARVRQGTLLESWHRAGSTRGNVKKSENLDFQNQSERGNSPVSFRATTGH